MSLRSHQHRKPSVYVTEGEHERLSNLAAAGASHGASILGDELARAIVVRDDAAQHRFVRLHSVVEFADLMTGRTRRVQIVLPDEADIDRDRLSVLTPVGASLIGLNAGDTISMSTEDGRPHMLEVRTVESAGAP